MFFKLHFIKTFSYDSNATIVPDQLTELLTPHDNESTMNYNATGAMRI